MKLLYKLIQQLSPEQIKESEYDLLKYFKKSIVHKKRKCENFLNKCDLRSPSMNGIYHDSTNGYAVSTNAFVLYMSKFEYDSNNADKIILQGKEIELEYIDYKKYIIPDDLVSFKTKSRDEIINLIVTAKFESVKKYGKIEDIYIQVFNDTEERWVRADKAILIADYTSDMNWYSVKNNDFSIIKGENENEQIYIMPSLCLVNSNGIDGGEYRVIEEI